MLSVLNLTYLYSSTKRLCLRNSMGFVHTSPLHRLPSDVTLKLQDGSIKAQKMMLACVSPVFEKMFYGNFKEATSKVVELPGDSNKIMKLLLDIVFEESCEMESLDDIIPLMEVVERYQINKAPIQQMCDEAILAQMNASNCFILLPKFSNLMHEESIKKAADQVMKFTNNDVIANHQCTKELPENILLSLLHHDKLYSYDAEIFEFLVYWHQHQTHLGKSLELTSQLFACVRYTRIVPQILSSSVATCDLVDKELLSKAFQFVYTSCEKFGDDNGKCFKVKNWRKPIHSLSLKWESFGNVVLTRSNRYDPHPRVGGCFDGVPLDKYIIKSVPLQDKFHSFTLLDLYLKNRNRSTVLDNAKLVVAIQDTNEHYLLSAPIENNNLVTLCVYGNFLFLKLIDCNCNMVVSTFSITGNSPPFSICIRRAAGYSNKTTFSFKVN